MGERMRDDRHVEGNLDDIAQRPFARNREIAPGCDAVQFLAVEPDARFLRPGRNAQAQGHDPRPLGVADDSRVISPRIERIHVERHLPPAGKLARDERGRIEVERRRVAARREEFPEETEEAARTVRRAAVGVHVAMVLAVVAVAGKRRVAREFRAVRLHRREVGVVERLFDFVGPFGLAGDVEKLFAEAHPRRGDARLLQSPVGEVLLARAMEPGFGTGAPAGEVDLLLHDVLGRHDRGAKDIGRRDWT